MFNENTRTFLVNAIYLKSRWQHAFKPWIIRFYFNETDYVTVNSLYMLNMDYNFGYLKELDASGLEVNYGNSNFTFVIILPNNRTGLTALEDQLKNYDLATVFDEMYITKIDVQIPKFKVETEIQLNEILQMYVLNLCKFFYQQK